MTKKHTKTDAQELIEADRREVAHIKMHEREFGKKMTKPSKPTKAPCKSCPYRRDVPAGVWHKHEYQKLRDYDLPMHLQPQAAFHCHSSPDELCGGWVGCHEPENLISIRIGILLGKIDPVTLYYGSPVPLFETGYAAWKHGVSGIKRPDARARRVIERLAPKIARRPK